jgi:hypothetical protein
MGSGRVNLTVFLLNALYEGKHIICKIVGPSRRPFQVQVHPQILCSETFEELVAELTAAFLCAELEIWPRPPIVPDVESAQQATGPANFHADCVAAVQRQLGAPLSKLLRTPRYGAGDQKTRLVCAVSTEHNETGGTPYFWFAVHRSQLEYLESAPTGLLCFGCGSPDCTLLIPISVIEPLLKQMSLSTGEDRHYWHVVVQRRNGRLLLRLLGSLDGPDLNEFLVQSPSPAVL